MPDVDPELWILVHDSDLKELSKGDLPPGVAEFLLDHPDVNVRWGMATNPNADPALLAKLAEDHDWQVRTKVAEHPKTPTASLRKLAKDTHSQFSVAINPSTPAAILRDLAFDSSVHYTVLGQVARNPNTPVDALQHLAKNDHAETGAAAKALKERGYA